MTIMDEKVVESYKMWFPNFYERTTDYHIIGYSLLLVTLKDGTKLEYCSLDNSICDVTKFYNPEFTENISESEWRKMFGHRLKVLLHDRNIKHETLAEMLNISKVMVSKYINGTATPSSFNMRRIAKYLGCIASDLIDFDYISKGE